MQHVGQVDEKPREFLLLVARKAALSTSGTVADVFRKTKSQAYLFGRLKKQFPDRDPEELRRLVTKTRYDLMGDESAHVVAERPTRPPSRGREPIDSPKWDSRLRKLQQVIDVPMTTDELLAKAKRELRWSNTFFTAVISASEGRSILEYEPPYWMPAPDQETRKVPKTSRVKTKKIQLEIHCILNEEERKKIYKQVGSLQTRKGFVVSQLDDIEKKIRAKHRLELKSACSKQREELANIERTRERLLEYIATGTAPREIQCEERLDYESGTVTVVRLDTLDIVDRRPMSADERQMEIEA